MAREVTHPQVPIEQLRWRITPETLAFETTDDIEPLDRIVGQNRALEALRFGIGMRKKGYNIFVTGQPRTGRLSTVKTLLKELPEPQTPAWDLCYVYNFKDSEAPVLLRFEAGGGSVFKKDINEFLESVKREVGEIFDSQEYIQRKKEIMEAHERTTREFFIALEKRVKESGFVLVNMKVGQTQRPDVVPLIDEEPVHMLDLEDRVGKGRFPRDEFEQLQKTQKELKEEIDAIFLDIRELQKEVKKKTQELDRHLYLNMADELLRPLRDKYAGNDKIIRHFNGMLDHMVENLDSLRIMGQPPQEGQIPGMVFMAPPPEIVFHPYQVNLLVDNAEMEGAPVIFESYPTYRNLFGSIERVMDRTGVWHTDFTKIKAGSFIKANGGYLVINLLDAIMEPGVWQTLKRGLKTSEIEIQTFDPFYLVTTTGVKPEPIPMEVKVVVLADPRLYQMLQYYDPDVAKIFKVRADFESSMDNTGEAVQQIARFVKRVVVEEKFRPFDRDAVAALAEEAVHMSGRQEKFSTAFPHLEDIISEADYFASLEDAPVATAGHVQKALEARIYRSNQIEERIQEMIDRGSIFIDVDGAVAGQVNGLAVYSLGDYMFGKPSRITCVTSMGKEGIINIEREADLSGPTHNKGMLILSGYLRNNFAQNKPLTLAASIAFEQSYGGVDGDSASSTELYALLSSLSGVPIKQSIAVTGSVNQRGEVQPIGGVNEKIEGFFLCCKRAGLTGEQGVMIPEPNLKDLMLKQEVIDAVKAGKFSIWSVKNINQGIEILTGKKAGERKKDGTYPAGSINQLVDAKLLEYAEGLRKFGEKEEDKKDAKKNGEDK